MQTTKNNHRRKSIVNEVRFPDSIKTDDRGMVRVGDLNPNDILLIQGRKIPAGKVPFSAYTLNCGHKGKGIAVTTGAAFYCEPCGDTRFVDEERS